MTFTESKKSNVENHLLKRLLSARRHEQGEEGLNPIKTHKLKCQGQAKKYFRTDFSKHRNTDEMRAWMKGSTNGPDVQLVWAVIIKYELVQPFQTEGRLKAYIHLQFLENTDLKEWLSKQKNTTVMQRMHEITSLHNNIKGNIKWYILLDKPKPYSDFLTLLSRFIKMLCWLWAL